MKRLYLLGVIFLASLAYGQNPATVTWSNYDHFNGYSNGDSIHTKRKWVREGLFQPFNQTYLVQSSQIQANNSGGAGRQGSVAFDSLMANDFVVAIIEGTHQSGTQRNTPDIEIYYGMSGKDTSATGHMIRLGHHNINGAAYWMEFHTVTSHSVIPQQQFATPNHWAIYPTNAVGDTISIRRNSTTHMEYVYVNSTCADSVLNNTGYNATGYFLVKSLVEASPVGIDAVLFGSLGASAPVTRDTDPPVLVYGTFPSSDSGTAIQMSLRATDNFGLDSIRYTLRLLNGANQESIALKCGTTADTTVYGTLAKHAPGTYEYFFRLRDDTGNVYNSPVYQAVIGTAATKLITTAYYDIWGYSGFPPNKIKWTAWNNIFHQGTDAVEVSGTTPYFTVLNTPADSIKYEGWDRGSVNLQKMLIDSATKHGTNVFVGIHAFYWGGQASGPLFSSLIADTNKVNTFVNYTAAYMQRKGYKGFEVNTEGPPSSDRANLTFFLKKWRQKLDTWSPKGLLAITVEKANVAAINTQSYDIAALNAYVDLLIVEMAESGVQSYKYTGDALPGDAVGLYKQACGSPTLPAWLDSLQGTGGNQQYVGPLGWLKAGVKKSIISPMIEGYGKGYIGILSPCDATSGITGNTADLDYVQVLALATPGREVRNNTTRAHYLSYTSGSKNMVVYEDSISVLDKINAMASLGFAQVSFFELYKSAEGLSRDIFGNTFQAAIVTNPPPVVAGQVTLVGPANGGTSIGTITQGSGVSVPFVWNSTTNATSYVLAVGTDTTLSNPFFPALSQPTDTTVTALSLVQGTKYYWKVTAYNNQTPGQPSLIRSFRTALVGQTVPNAPVGATPVNGATGQQTAVTLTWTTTAGDIITGEQVQISKDSTFATFLKSDSSASGTSYSVNGLAQLSTYYWRVRAKNGAGWGSYSSTFHFTVAGTAPVKKHKRTSIHFDSQGKLSTDETDAWTMTNVDPAFWDAPESLNTVNVFATGYIGTDGIPHSFIPPQELTGDQMWALINQSAKVGVVAFSFTTLSANQITVGALTVPGNTFIPDSTLPQLTADQNDLGLGTGTAYRLDVSAARNITGFSGGSSGRMVYLTNVSAFVITFKGNSSSSASGNRFSGSDATLAAGATTCYKYDVISGVWRKVF